MQGSTADRQAMADRIRHEHLHGDPKRRLVGWVIALAVIAGAVALIAVILPLLPTPGDDEAPEPANATEDYGFLLAPETDAAGEPIAVVLYEDFLCGSCRAFHDETGEFLTEQLEAGVISLEYRPIAFLLTASTDEYAQRAANAAVCVADEAGVEAYALMHDLLLEHQPEQGGAGLTDEQLTEFAAEAGATEAAECIEERTFEVWVGQALEASLAADVSVTPTVRVDGVNVVRLSDGQESIPGPEELEFAFDSLQEAQ